MKKLHVYGHFIEIMFHTIDSPMFKKRAHNSENLQKQGEGS